MARGRRVAGGHRQSYPLRRGQLRRLPRRHDDRQGPCGADGRAADQPATREPCARQEAGGATAPVPTDAQAGAGLRPTSSTIPRSFESCVKRRKSGTANSAGTSAGAGPEYVGPDRPCLRLARIPSPFSSPKTRHPHSHFFTLNGTRPDDVRFAFLWTFIRGYLLGSLTAVRHPLASAIQSRMDNLLERSHLGRPAAPGTEAARPATAIRDAALRTSGGPRGRGSSREDRKSHRKAL